MGPRPHPRSLGKCPNCLPGPSLPEFGFTIGRPPPPPTTSLSKPLATADPWWPLSILHTTPPDWSGGMGGYFGSPKRDRHPLLSQGSPAQSLPKPCHLSGFLAELTTPLLSLSLSPCSGGRSLGEDGPPARGASSPTPPVSIKSERLSPAPGGPGDFPKTFPYPLLLARPLAEPLRPGPPLRRLPTADGWPR